MHVKQSHNIIRSEYLNFVEPFTKSRKQSGNMSLLLPSNNCEKEITTDLSASENEEENDETNQPDASTSSFIEPSPKIYVNKAAHDFFVQRKKTVTAVEEDLDLCFLKSVLPDMKCMTPDQKRRFKVGVINLSGSILNEKNISFGDQNQITSGYSTQYHNLERSSNLESPAMLSSSR
ncbi:BESS domain-containing protein [Aphis craccivora]|uniref:BESS domain-containing protein n=1 Tax=Aphis craccivora TaxID=307492 RepID=A0A6G0X3H1_APHCR|nr:BESS domain-containing protein [Aphis craccivora]